MAYHYILFMLAVIAGIYLWPEEEVKVDAAGKTNTQQLELSLETMNKHSADRTVKTPSTYSVETVKTSSKVQLANSQGRELVVALEQFWRECQRLDDCALQLSNLKLQLSKSRYQLLLRYLDLNKDWQRIWVDTELNHLVSLSDKVAEFKQFAAMVWGDFANVIFADEFALYDFSLELGSLSDTSVEEFVDDYQALLAKWQRQEVLLVLESDHSKYEKGVSIIPITYSPDQVQEIKNQLAKRYLTDKDLSAIIAREQQVVQQNDKVDQYQTKLSALNESLRAQRQITNLSDSEWQTYTEKEISKFRKDYFRYQ
ncbi:chromosome segregation ATPase [Vibrio pectenicida]|uniref:Chromosome segregation ATPase n=1 Tax=Vibrio pectenicida TaxID=62763 RepID=A0A7Y4A147_9VIBR|nr:chromosome segregation ATPase [Vibrio pectenicida]NOH72556.1 chromosome segregation ATPase [Vibrio pectenicida]